MCFHGNQLSWGIKHPIISLCSKYHSQGFICLSTMLAPVISSLDEIYCMPYQPMHSNKSQLYSLSCFLTFLCSAFKESWGYLMVMRACAQFTTTRYNSGKRGRCRRSKIFSIWSRKFFNLKKKSAQTRCLSTAWMDAPDQDYFWPSSTFYNKWKLWKTFTFLGVFSQSEKRKNSLWAS